MRTISVDSTGLSFTIKVVSVALGLVTLWWIWHPLHQHFATQDVQQRAHANISEQDEAERAAVIERLRYDASPAHAQARVGGTLPSSGKYIWIDVDTGRVTLFNDEHAVAVLPLVHRPDADSADAPVQGLYSVNRVEPVEVSTVTKVRFPHYIRFGDRFAIHGTPTAGDGGTFTSIYDGSSLVLGQSEAQTLFEFVTLGMPVYVEQAAAPGQRDFSEVVLKDVELPGVSARAVALADLQTGQTYLLKQSGERFPIASITKLVTAVAAGELVGYGAEVRAPNGSMYLLSDLIYPLLLRSDNGVAAQIAAHAGTDEFIAHMNAYVRSIGMDDTSFADSSGLSPRNISSARDLITLAQYLFDKKQYILGMTLEDRVTITSTTGVAWDIVNQNKLAADPHFRGGKLGFTDEAGQTSLAIFNVPVGGTTRPIATIVLGSEDWKQDTRTLLQWLVDSTSL